MSKAYSFQGLRKKEWRRSPQWETKLVIRVLMVLVAIYFIACFVMIGLGGYFVLAKEAPSAPPVSWVNRYLFYYLAAELSVRFLAQQLPTTRIQQFLLFPIPKKKIITDVLRRSWFSIYNSSLLFLFLPFAVVLAVMENNIVGAALWWFSVSLLVISIGHINFLLNKSRLFYPIALVLLLSVLLEKLDVFSVAQLLGRGMQWLMDHPVGIVIPLTLFGLSYAAVYQMLSRNLYLDAALQKKAETHWGNRLQLLDRWGLQGAIIKNDIRMLLRNVRARQVLFFAGIFLLYGLIFFPQDTYKGTVMEVFAALFTTGGFLMMFSQNVPAWDSEYFKLLMAQRLSLYEYLFSKWLLMVLSLVVTTIAALPYLYFGGRVYAIILAGSFYNAGFGTIIGLVSGALNLNPITLNVKAKAFENTQSFTLTQFLLTLPKIGFPMLVFWVPYYYLGWQAAAISLAGVGLVGLVLTRPLLTLCVRLYKDKKHEMIRGFYKNT